MVRSTGRKLKQQPCPKQIGRLLSGDASMTTFTRRDFGKAAGTLAVGAAITATRAHAQDASPDERARMTEQQMTDDERFSLVVSLIGAVPSIGVLRDKRIPEGVNMSAGYTPGIPRLRIPALQSSDASMGVTNPGYRPDDKGATAFPASIVVGASFNPRLARDRSEEHTSELQSLRHL